MELEAQNHPTTAQVVSAGKDAGDLDTSLDELHLQTNGLLNGDVLTSGQDVVRGRLGKSGSKRKPSSV